MVSSTPVTVTVCAVSQLPFVNVNVAGDTVASPVSADETATTTSERGWVVNTTVNESADPVSSTTVEPSLCDTDTPGESSSEVVTVTVWSANKSNTSSLKSASTEIVIVVSCGPSVAVSSTPVTVTVWALSQFADVNEIDVGNTVASLVLREDTMRTTLEVGWVSSTTLNVPVDPASVTVTVVPDRVYPATSSSNVVAVRVWSANGSNALSLEASTESVIVVTWVPSSMSSSTLATVTVCALSQLPDVNVNVAGDTVTSPSSKDKTEMTTGKNGSESRTTVNESIDPVSSTISAVTSCEYPVSSSSLVVTVTA